MSCICALASGTALSRWLRTSPEARRRMWRHYGWFSGTMLLGSGIATLTWASWMQFSVNYFIATDYKDAIDNTWLAQSVLLIANANRWRAVYNITCATASHLHRFFVTLSPGTPYSSFACAWPNSWCLIVCQTS